MKETACRAKPVITIPAPAGPEAQSGQRIFPHGILPENQFLNGIDAVRRGKIDVRIRQLNGVADLKIRSEKQFPVAVFEAKNGIRNLPDIARPARFCHHFFAGKTRQYGIGDIRLSKMALTSSPRVIGAVMPDGSRRAKFNDLRVAGLAEKKQDGDGKKQVFHAGKFPSKLRNAASAWPIFRQMRDVFRTRFQLKK